jgi:hypothetical protein
MFFLSSLCFGPRVKNVGSHLLRHGTRTYFPSLDIIFSAYIYIYRLKKCMYVYIFIYLCAQVQILSAGDNRKSSPLKVVGLTAKALKQDKIKSK